MNDDEIRAQATALLVRLGWRAEEATVGVGDRAWIVYCHYAGMRGDVTEHAGWPVKYETIGEVVVDTTSGSADAPPPPADVATLVRLLEAATPGPWLSLWDDANTRQGAGDLDNAVIETEAGEFVVGIHWYDGPNIACSKPNAALIVAAVNALPQLLARLAAAEAVATRAGAYRAAQRAVRRSYLSAPCCAPASATTLVAESGAEFDLDEALTAYDALAVRPTKGTT